MIHSLDQINELQQALQSALRFGTVSFRYEPENRCTRYAWDFDVNGQRRVIELVVDDYDLMSSRSAGYIVGELYRRFRREFESSSFEAFQQALDRRSAPVIQTDDIMMVMMRNNSGRSLQPERMVSFTVDPGSPRQEEPSPEPDPVPLENLRPKRAIRIT